MIEGAGRELEGTQYMAEKEAKKIGQKKLSRKPLRAVTTLKAIPPDPRAKL
jgi:hypothetical protein